MMKVDRIEGKYAVVENNDTYINVPLEEIKGTVKEGCVLKKEKNCYIVDNKATDSLRKEMCDLQNSIFD